MQLRYALALFAIVFSIHAQAQQASKTPKALPCTDTKTHSDLVTIDNRVELQGYKLIQYKTMDMPSGRLLPIYINLEEDEVYQINFIPSENFQQYTFVLVDKDRKKWIDIKVKQKDNKPQLSENFIAPYTGEYAVVLTQKVKGQDEACAGFSVLLAVNDHK